MEGEIGMKNLLMGIVDTAMVANAIAICFLNPPNWEMAFVIFYMIATLSICSSPIIAVADKIAGD